MDWAFVNPGMFLMGLAAAAPVIVHLVMKPRPKVIVFPPLRFLELTARRATSMSRLRNLLLLLARMLILALLAPSIALAEEGSNPVVAFDQDHCAVRALGDLLRDGPERPRKRDKAGPKVFFHCKVFKNSAAFHYLKNTFLHNLVGTKSRY